MTEGKSAFITYVNAAEDLAQAIKENIQHGGKILPETVAALNRFIIASNTVKDMTDEIKRTEQIKH